MQGVVLAVQSLPGRDDKCGIPAVRASPIPLRAPVSGNMLVRAVGLYYGGSSLAVLEFWVIRHIVFFTVSDENLADARAGLLRLGEIPHARLFELGVNLKRDLYANEVDLVVYAEFETVSDLDAYKAHPLYGEITAAVRPLRKTRVAADFDSAAAAQH